MKEVLTRIYDKKIIGSTGDLLEASYSRDSGLHGSECF